MQLPNVDAAIVSQEKIIGYLLNPLHPDGAGKAQFFEAMGFRVDQWNVLANALRDMAKKAQIVHGIDSSHGGKYIVDGVLETPSGRKVTVRSVWIVDRDESVPRLVTAYPHRLG